MHKGQKFGECQLCQGIGIVNDYGPNGEYICVECAVTKFEFPTIMAEMQKRLGEERVIELVQEILSDKTKH